MSGSCSTIDADLELQISQCPDKKKYSKVYTNVLKKIGDDLAEKYGYIDGTHEENKSAWFTFLNGTNNDYDKQLGDFNDINAYKFILSAFFDEIPELEVAMFTLTYIERSGGYTVSDRYEKNVFGEKDDDGKVKFYLSEQVKVWETTEIE